MNLQQLEYILSVNAHRHFGRAAEACHVTQPTLSMMIQKLEDELGVRIFDRSQHPVKPTDIGSMVINQSRNILKEVQNLKDLIINEQETMTGVLQVGIIPTLAPYLLPLFVKAFLEKYTEIHLNIKEIVTDKLIEKLLSREVDIGIFVPVIESASLHSSTLFYEEFYVYSSQFYTKEYILPKDIDPDRLWLLEEGHCFRSQTLNLCELQRMKDGRLKYEAGSLETLKNLVDYYDGITLLPELATFTLSLEQSNDLKRFKSPAPVREVCLFTHKDFLKKRMLKALKEEILLHIPDKVKNKDQFQLVDI